MSKHIGSVFHYFSIAVMSAVIVFISPEVSPAAVAAHRGSLPMATGSTRNGPSPNPCVSKTSARVLETYGRLPLYFIANRGQVNKKAAFYETGPGHATFFTRKGIVLSLRRMDRNIKRVRREAVRPQALSAQSSARSAAGLRSSYLGIRMLGINKGVQIVPEDTQPGKVNYFIGNDPRKWRTNIPTYGAVLYRKVYPGIDVKFYGNNRRLEYDIIVRPGANPSKVKFQYSGARDVRVTATGDLSIELNDGRLVFKKPGVYQELNGRRVFRQGKFEVRQDKPATGVFNTSDKTASTGAKLRTFTCSFEVGAYDRKIPLVIDPQLVYSTYLGGNGDDEVYGLAVDGNGNAYLTGMTTSTDFPASNGFQSTYGAGGCDAFVTEIAAGGKSVVYSTYLGGSGDDELNAISLDSTGNAYVAGWTDSTDFPVNNAIQSVNGGGCDAVVTEIAAGGKSLVYSTYLGGSVDQEAYGIAVDEKGNAYVTGVTSSIDFPVNNGLQSTYGGGGCDAFVTEIAAAGKGLVYSTYLGGSGDDEAYSIAVDSSGNAYVAGLTGSTDFPVNNALQSVNGGGCDAFVTEIAAGGKSLVYSTYLGGSGDDEASGIAVDSSGNAYVTGTTVSADFPTHNAIQSTYGADSDAFVTEIAAAGQSLVYSTFLGGSRDDSGNCIAVDGSGNTYVTGTTLSTDFRVNNALQSVNGGGYDAVVTEIEAGGKSLVYSTFLGGSGDDEAWAISVDGSGNAYVAGWTASTDLPTANALQPAFGGSDDDAFLTEIGGLWQNAKDLGNGWKWLDWFGYFATTDTTWIYHDTLGWLYPFGTSTDNIWFWDAKMETFWWTSRTTYPYVYRASDGAWLYYAQGTSSPRLFYNFKTGMWERD
ncbi:MAG: SBBP repeat-containing protein [Deltaproteobacteria bacterium]|jgi:hypothetical protein|nr:SBBP repeat-containing protein [Deltaproteobacteria bacterium]